MTLLNRRILRIGAVSGAALLAASCAETQLGAQAVKQVARNDAPASAGPELAPDAFDATGLTIWDGASTLEGVWVAHPLAQRAQRVRVVNEENEIAIEGAMFRRDPTLSGPSILVSSDAARLLGLQPGVPTELRIIALREGVYAAPATATAQTDGSEASEAGSVETAALPAPEPRESEAAEDLAAEDAATAEDAPERPVFSATGGETEETETAAETTEDAAPESPATPAEPATSDAPAAETTAAPAPAVRERERPKTAITAADLRGETTVAAAPAQAAAPAPAQPATAVAEPAAAPERPTPAAAPATPEPTQTAAAAQAAAPASSGAFQGNLPSGRFVQAGAFSVEPNAASLVRALRADGLPAQYVQREVSGAALNIVMIGPLADDAAADAAIAAAAKAGAPGARKVIR